jgi:hypothetical protein
MRMRTVEELYAPVFSFAVSNSYRQELGVKELKSNPNRPVAWKRVRFTSKIGECRPSD